jgi:flagellar hook-associated protein 3 FlgL
MTGIIGSRVTHRGASATVYAGLQDNLAALTKLQERLSSGKEINRPSDSPAGTASALNLRSDMRAHEQYVRNADDGIGWLATLDNSLMSSSDQLRRVREVMLHAMSDGSGGSQPARIAAAAEVEQLRESLRQTANATYLDRPVFGRNTAGPIAFDASGAYVGTPTGEVTRVVGPQSTVRVDMSGPEAFGSGAEQLFKVLDDVVLHLRTDASALNGDLDLVDKAMTRIGGALAEVGSRQARVDQLKSGAESKLIDLRSQLSGVEDVDLPKTITDLQVQQLAYQAALAATSKVIQPSLVDFLR